MMLWAVASGAGEGEGGGKCKVVADTSPATPSAAAGNLGQRRPAYPTRPAKARHAQSGANLRRDQPTRSRAPASGQQPAHARVWPRRALVTWAGPQTDCYARLLQQLLTASYTRRIICVCDFVAAVIVWVEEY